MSEIDTEDDIFEQIEDFHSEIKKVNKSHYDKSSQYNYERILNLTRILDNERHQKALKIILDRAHVLSEERYSSENHIGLIMGYELIGANFTNTLIESFLNRYNQLVQKEVRFLKMQAPDKDFFWSVAETAQASIANLYPIRGKLNQQQKYTNVLLKEVMDYRLFILDDETAWDFAAQTILSETKTIPS